MALDHIAGGKVMESRVMMGMLQQIGATPHLGQESREEVQAKK
jgi:hypothetical protein